ncbi:hypothetical protein NUH88_02240 [Nisaea acidiphila]|uniref:Uncharacterized protein n=1 Tax=Nisaea acidiphila TaxID=1862145 RepID=A0A9J7AT96_9PROT|nr:hypothetical protein [Nisaea acidiphila]UUX50519.1 hypothetical protein NUH88_02240 [Nisaea acidiphila]
MPEITVPPVDGCVPRALLAGCPTERTRTGKSVPGGNAVTGRGAAEAAEPVWDEAAGAAGCWGVGCGASGADCVCVVAV